MKEVVAYVTASHGLSERRACALMRQHRYTQRKPSTQDPRLEIRHRIHEIARVRIRHGYRSHREEGLARRSKQPKRRKIRE